MTAMAGLLDRGASGTGGIVRRRQPQPAHVLDYRILRDTASPGSVRSPTGLLDPHKREEAGLCNQRVGHALLEA